MESSGRTSEREVLCSSTVAVVAGQIKNPYQDVKIVWHCRKPFVDFAVRELLFSMGVFVAPSFGSLIRSSFVQDSISLFILHHQHPLSQYSLG